MCIAPNKLVPGDRVLASHQSFSVLYLTVQQRTGLGVPLLAGTFEYENRDIKVWPEVYGSPQKTVLVFRRRHRHSRFDSVRVRGCGTMEVCTCQLK
jgi:hypothetical protein